MKRFLICLCFSSNLLARPDTEYGAATIAVQADGKYVVSGASIKGTKAVAMRYFADGASDLGFGVGGKFVADLTAHCEVARVNTLLSDGSIVLAGSQRRTNGCPRRSVDEQSFILKLTETGTLDPHFGQQGITSLAFSGESVRVAGISSDSLDRLYFSGYSGEAVLGVYGRHFIGRLNTDGTLDTNFGNDGFIYSDLCTVSIPIPSCVTWVRQMVIDSSGKIYLVGGASTGFRFSYIERYTAAGDLDPSFGGTGRLVFKADSDHYRGFEAISIDAKENIYVLTPGDDCLFVYKFGPNGKQDSSFGLGGRGRVSFGTGWHFGSRLALTPQGGVLALGSVWNRNGVAGRREIGIALLTSGGDADHSFGTFGKIVHKIGLVTLPNDIFVEPAGILVAGGTTIDLGESGSSFVMRLLYDGSLDKGFGTDGVVIDQIW